MPESEKPNATGRRKRMDGVAAIVGATEQAFRKLRVYLKMT
jgi:hypothetical protein